MEVVQGRCTAGPRGIRLNGGPKKYRLLMAVGTPDQEHAVTLGSVMNLIGTLPAAQRQALLLVGAEGFTYEAAAARLGCQVGTVKSQVSRARSFLFEALAREARSPGFVEA
jgi:DNA-directed RNA polymerase specialized sigma24 family protein